MSKKSGFVPATFRDAGTEQTFEGGQDHSFDAGAHSNYLAAGLIEPSKPKPAAKAVAKPAAKRARRAPAPRKATVPPASVAPATGDAASE